MWREIEASKSFSLNMHVPTADGSRGAYGSRIYRVGDDDYGSGVHGKLLDANYDVDVLARGQ